MSVVDIYAYQAVRTLTKDQVWGRYLYWGLSIAFLVLLVLVIINFDRSAGPQHPLFKIFMGSFVLLFVPKLIISAPLLLEDIVRIIVGISGKIISSSEGGPFMPSRRKFVSQMALALAAIPFAGILHGIFKGKYNYRVIKKTLFFPDLPDAFDGFRLTQISDVHSGSFDNPEKIAYGINLINQQRSDLILFTGDLVNNVADEMEPWKEVFSTLNAPMGKYSILGNHDYGDYVNWPSAEAKAANMQKLYRTHADIGFDLLRNENRVIEKDGERIRLVGVENWGKGFAQHGDLELALQDTSEQEFHILMSHDPSHFDEVVKKHPKKMSLTLSGHTHGMQFGIEIPGVFRWSPVKYRYPKWAGLYEDAGRYLYVNRGFGFLAFPGRVGIWPEITVLELRKGEANA
ncbi:metallophosphoesterase [Croceimicrobium hydrocarbonivorans]|uniref:Metallophosphoesterase n=2 Tax=Croceimicrobium hydrocarbonivorans TaxID=2761580 RepID=A0A7H0VK01_9FLAO|nr:metallophosphoesterase [Croceimicrobium hydrocarbonivorans]